MHIQRVSSIGEYSVPILSQIEYPCIISIINSKCQLFQCRSLLKASFVNRWTRRRDIELASSWTKFGIGQMYILEDWALVQSKKDIFYIFIFSTNVFGTMLGTITFFLKC
jgi:hypothetical protein